jgi:hypothetical protein
VSLHPHRDAGLPTGWRRPFVRFWLRHGWRGVALVSAPVLLVLVAVGYSLVHPSPTGATVAMPSGSFTFDPPRGWNVQFTCSDNPLHGRTLSTVVPDSACARPDRHGDAGAYVMSVDVDSSVPPRKALTTLIGDLTTAAHPYDTCGTQSHDEDTYTPSADICLMRSDASGQLRLKIYKTFAVVVLCLHSERADVKQGCDLVWQGVHVTE